MAYDMQEVIRDAVMCKAVRMTQPCVCSQELASLRQKLAVRYTGTLEADFASQLDSRLETAIDELRERSEQEITQYKLEIEAVYKDKVCVCVCVRVCL